MPSTDDIAKAKTHKHILVLRKNIQKQINGNNFIGKLNTSLAVFVTKIVGSMWCAYLFTILSLISLPAAIKTHDPIIIVAWIAQTFLQLILLPIIIVGQNVQAEASDQRAQHDHDTLMAIHTLISEVYKINEQQNKILEVIERKK